MHSKKLSWFKIFNSHIGVVKTLFIILLSVSILSAVSNKASAQQASATRVDVPDWALPGSATHKQVPPPADFHRATRTDNTPIGVFEGQSDVGAALVPGSSSYNEASKQYTIVSAGYNLWYQRDEFRYLWKKMSGDVSLAADIDFPDTAGYGDRKAFVVIRQSLEDDSKEAVVALHGAGLLHLAWRPEKGQMMKEVRANNRRNLPDLVTGHISRIGIEKHGDYFTLFVSTNGEPMHQVGDPIELRIDGPFYAGVGFCSHLPAKTDTAILSNVVLENSAGKLK
ncbi:MAG: biopolymer transporter Tol [Bacteroidota bacterium]|nr:biopolymer transporter Tol [Bacteroidota bacterium]